MSFFANSFARQFACKIYAVPVLLGLGIAFYFAWPHEPGILVPALVAGVWAAVAFWLFGVNRRGVDVTGLVYIVAALCVVQVGFVAAKVRAEYVAAPMITAPMGPMGVTGRVQSLEQLDGKAGYRLILDQLVMDGVPAEQTPHSIRLSVRKGGDILNTGQIIRVFAKIEPASFPTTPGGFDFRRHAYFKQIGGYGYVLGAPEVKQDRPSANAEGPVDMRPEALGSSPRDLISYLSIFESARNAITAHVNNTLSPRQAGMVGALLTGERAAIAEEDWQALRDSGLAHLLAISGANVDMVALIVFFVVRLMLAAFPRLAERHAIKKYAAVAAFCAATLYVLLILPSTPTLRALLTVSIVLLAVLLDRSPISLRLVCTVAALILLFQPEQLLSPSFQLSFAAVTALVAVFEAAAPWLKRVHRDATAVKRMCIYIVGVCVTTAIATLATAPISLYHFQTLALYGVLANVLAVPLMTFLIMPLSILCYPLLAVGGADSTLYVLGVLNEWILVIAHNVSDLKGARFTPPAMPLSTFLWIVTTGLILCLGVARIKILSLVPLCFAVITAATYNRADMAVLSGGKVVMMRMENGEIVTNTRRYARRQQADWVRYWGGDENQGARVDKEQIDSLLETKFPKGLPPLEGRGRGGVPSANSVTSLETHSALQDILCLMQSLSVTPPSFPPPQGGGESIGALCLQNKDSPVAVYWDNPTRVEIVRPRGQGRLWQ
jgi:competence protein ComEC